jgi:hypothetical protein
MLADVAESLGREAYAPAEAIDYCFRERLPLNDL